MNGWLFQYAYNSINNLSILFGPVCEAWNNQLITLLTGQFGDEIALGGKLTSQARSNSFTSGNLSPNCPVKSVIS